MTEAAQDWLSRDGGETLARRIEGYWREQGTRVVVWLVPMRGGAGRRLAFGLASNLSKQAHQPPRI